MLELFILIILAVPVFIVGSLIFLTLYGLFMGFRQDYFDRHPIR